MRNDELIENLELFKSGCISQLTGGSFDAIEYKRIRGIILNESLLKDKVPYFIKVNRTPNEMFSYLQPIYPTYKERRKFIAEEINLLIQIIEDYKSDDPFVVADQFDNMERIGNGGFGEVYKLHNDYLDMNFAVKIYNPIFITDDGRIEGEKRFFREAKMMFYVNSNYVARIYDVGRYDGKPFIKMEYIEGQSLLEFQNQYGCLSFQKSIKVIKDILFGLQAAHSKGIIHRDLKPSNIMFCRNEKVFKIIDFGVSAFIDSMDVTKLTHTGEIVAGGQFIDPLIQLNPKLKDCRSDLYSVGAIWYYLLCGQAPIGSNMKEYMEKQISISSSNRDIIMKCLSSNIDDRYKSADELLNVIESI